MLLQDPFGIGQKVKDSSRHTAWAHGKKHAKCSNSSILSRFCRLAVCYHWVLRGHALSPRDRGADSVQPPRSRGAGSQGPCAVDDEKSLSTRPYYPLAVSLYIQILDAYQSPKSRCMVDAPLLDEFPACGLQFCCSAPTMTVTWFVLETGPGVWSLV